MQFIVSFITAFRSLKNHLKRTILTTLGITIGISSIITILSLGKGFENEITANLTENNLEEIEIQLDFIPSDTTLYESSRPFFNDEDIFHVKKIRGIKDVQYSDFEIESVTKSILIKDMYKTKQIRLFKESMSNYDILEGRYLLESDNIYKNRVAVIDQATAIDLYNSSEMALNKSILIDGIMFQIVGIYQLETNNEIIQFQELDNIQVPKETYYRFFGKNEDASRLTIRLDEGTDPKVISDNIIRTLQDKGFMRSMGTYQVFDSTILTESMKSILNSATYFIGSVAGISLLIAGIGIMNMMYISVYERTREIAIKRAIGSTKRDIMFQFLLEGMILTTTGGALGYLFGLVFANAVGQLVNITVSVDLLSVILAIGISNFIGLVFTIIPSYEASRKPLIDILK